MRKKFPLKKQKKVVMVSGGFDPIHVGHLDMLKEAKELGDELMVVLNNDNWLKMKKGRGFMSAADRKEIIEAFKFVDRVVITRHPKNPKNAKEMSISRELLKIRPHIFANGGDRNEKDAQNPKSSLYHDIAMCRKLGIEMVFNVGKKGKIRSSSDLLKEYSEKATNKK
jgi:cytidyltransferase-like protein